MTRSWLRVVVGALLISSAVTGLGLTRDVPAFEGGPDFGSSGSPPADQAVAFARVDALKLGLGENRPAAIAIDSVNGFAYVGTFTAPALIIKVDLRTFEPVATLESLQDYFPSAVIDEVEGFAYFGTGVPTGDPVTHPARIVKVDLATFTLVDTLTLEAGEDRLPAAVIDPANGFAYFGVAASPARVVRVNLITFEREGALTLGPGEDLIRSAVIDRSRGFAYFGTWTSPGRVVKVDLASFTHVATLRLPTGVNDLLGGVIDPIHGFAYFATWTDPGLILKVDLATFEWMGTVVLEEGEETRRPAAIDPVNAFAYFGTLGAPGRVVKVGLNPFERVEAITLETGENNLFAAAFDPEEGFAYFLTDTHPGRVVKVLVGPDTVPPVLTVPETIIEEATGPEGAVVTFEATAADIVDSSPSIFCVPASGSTFPLGTTTVACTGTDRVANAATASFTVTVQDTTPPTLSLPVPIQEAATGSPGATVTYLATATDLVDGPLTPVCIPPSGSLFPVGGTTVTCNAADSEGNRATGSFTVTVTAPPSDLSPAIFIGAGVVAGVVGTVALYLLRRKEG